MRDIGKNIKSLRTEKNMTQDELAQLLFVTRQTVSNYETGNSRPDVDMLLKIAEVFGVEVNTVIYGPQIDPELQRRRVRTGILIGATLLLGLLLLWAINTVNLWVEQYAGKYFIIWISPQLILKRWLKPVWLLLTGWVFMHSLCEFCGTRTLKPPTSSYIKWTVIGLLVGYVILILPHSVWFILEEIKSIQRYQNGFAGEYSSSFSVFPAWDRLAYLVMNLTKPRPAIFSVLDVMPLPLGALLRLCRNPKK